MTEKICYTIERHVSGISLAGTIKYAPVAQLDRALDSDSKGRWFESSRAYQLRLLKKMQPLKPLLRQGFQPFQREKSSTSRDGDAKGHFRDVG